MSATIQPTRPTVEPREDQTFHHGTRSDFNAWFFRVFDRYINHIARHHKREAFAGMRAGDIVELGAGVGANFAHLPAGARVLAVEPSRAMHDELVARATDRAVDLTVLGACAEDLPIPDASVDEVICSLVLCTVKDQAAALAEIRRVLRPGGSFRFVEHVAAPAWSPRRWLQHAIRRPWSWLFEGCDLCRDTVASVEEAGFREMQVRRARFRRSLFTPVNSAVYGYGIR
ncbi:class I SAM-dependent methyltransferase [Rhabdothermincola salaria]|uniref:class I SAM-dependent methyltransferase n=1 Tax=Rhabdothermincola salaria TaxID=2903142 RepID=UPI001E39523E|nr:class I SAM-dependent methyltransferase [Rhabdothermincola salaria]MCD9625679.1 class I SAM-dependent methyltransferase [Rhabdothermincola salaria]